MDTSSAMRMTVGLAGIGVAISSLEYMACPRLLADDALASWPVCRTNRPWKLSRAFDATLGWLFLYPNFIAVVAVRLLAAVVVVLGWPLPGVATASIIALTSALLALRSPYGTDGADQMTLIIFVAAALADFVGTSGAANIFLWFVTAQACLAYFVAGVAKLSSPVWRDGYALPGILGTSSYGYPELGRLLSRHRDVARLFGWGVIILECCFPAVLLGIRPLTYTLLALALAFHLSAIFLMRLNTFFWAFLATYPSIMFCTLK
jgi:HTTM domain